MHSYLRLVVGMMSGKEVESTMCQWKIDSLTAAMASSSGRMAAGGSKPQQAVRQQRCAVHKQRQTASLLVLAYVEVASGIEHCQHKHGIQKPSQFRYLQVDIDYKL